ncbi:hypothetical protein ACWCPT_06605 [Streptomyces sp. NPDC002308]
MTDIRASVSAFTPRRHGLAAFALAALTLTGCGTEPSGSAAPAESASSIVSAHPSPAQPPAGQAAFAAMIDAYAQGCPPADGTPPVPAAERLPVPKAAPSLAPGETPPTDAIEPGAPTGPEAELSARDWCTAGRHEQAVHQALYTITEPTPAKVRDALNRLGYVDARIHALRQDGRTTRFYLDLRESGGQLCVSGLAAGEATNVTKCVARADGPFTVTTEEPPEQS